MADQKIRFNFKIQFGIDIPQPEYISHRYSDNILNCLKELKDLYFWCKVLNFSKNEILIPELNNFNLSSSSESDLKLISQKIDNRLKIKKRKK